MTLIFTRVNANPISRLLVPLGSAAHLGNECFIVCAPDDCYVAAAITNDLMFIGVAPHTVVRRILICVDLHPSIGIRALTKNEIRPFAH